MFELHCWITIRETYEVKENEEENIDVILYEIERKIQELKWNKPQIKVCNGEWYIETSIFSNRKTEKAIELLEFFDFVARTAYGSYGVIYILDDEDLNGKNNEFQVYSISRGTLHEQKDTFLSPFIPTVEDANV